MKRIERDDTALGRPRSPRSFGSYGLAVVAVLVTVTIKFLSDHYIGHGPPLILFVLPVLFAAWYGGLGPGLVATAVSALACTVLYFPPVGMLAIDSKNDAFRLFLFGIEGVVASVLMGQLHAARVVAEDRMRLLVDREEALRSSEERLRLLVDGVKDYAILMLDPAGVIVSWNSAAERIKGYRAEEVIGRHFSLFYPPDATVGGKPARELEVAASTGRFEEEAWRLRKDGSRFRASVTIAAVRDTAGVLRGFAKVTRDISDRFRAEVEIHDLNTRLEQRLQRLGALRRIDLAISSSLDLRVATDTLLDQVIDQLHVDAAVVLRLDPNSHTLEYAGGQGFRNRGVCQSRFLVGNCHAGRAVLERHRVHIPDLSANAETCICAPLLKDEGFVAYFAVPLLAKGHVCGVLEVFHRAPLEPDPEWLEFLEALAGQAAIAIDNASLFEDLQRSNLELTLAYDATIEGWSKALDLRDKETDGHSRRVTEMTVRIARAMGLGEAELVQVRRGAMLHDIGKMGIPDAILLKPGPLTDEEWVIMRRHPTLAYEMLSPIAFLRPALEIPYCHHEKWDGTGYPRGLEGEQISLPARIFAAVDIWDALRSDRPYRAAWPADRVREHIRSLAGTHLDPNIVATFLRDDDVADGALAESLPLAAPWDGHQTDRAGQNEAVGANARA